MFIKDIKKEVQKLKSQGKIENKDFRLIYFGTEIEIKLIK